MMTNSELDKYNALKDFLNIVGKRDDINVVPIIHKMTILLGLDPDKIIKVKN